MISLRRIAISSIVSAAFVAGGITAANAQSADGSNDATGDQQEDRTPAPSELLKSLSATPASKLDVGLLAAEMKLFAYFTVNKPNVLKKERLRFLAVDYLDIDDEILVQLSHLSTKSTPEELAAECREDVELAQAALVPRLGRAEKSKPAYPLDESLACRTITSMFFGTETTVDFLSREMGQPDDNLCRHIRFYARVSSTERAENVHCYKSFFSPNIEVTHEQGE